MLGGIPAKTILQYAREARLPCLRIGRHVRFVRGDVERALAEQRSARVANRRFGLAVSALGVLMPRDGPLVAALRRAMSAMRLVHDTRLRVVVPAAAGSSPVAHPSRSPCKRGRPL